MFETFVSKVTPDKAKRVYEYFHEYEAHYGDLAQVYKLEKRMQELYPSSVKLTQFSTRYSYHQINPCAFLPVISPSQARPKAISHLPLPPEAAAAALAAAGLPIPPPPPPPGVAPVHGLGGTFHQQPIPIPQQQLQQQLQQQQRDVPAPGQSVRVGSPKRNAPDADDFDSSRARKLPRSDSPVPVLKGAAGRRLNQIKQQQAAAAAAAAAKHQQQDPPRRDYVPPPAALPASRPPPPPQTSSTNPSGIPEALLGLLSILPGADRYNAVRFRPEAMVALLASVALPGGDEAGRRAGGVYYGS